MFEVGREGPAAAGPGATLVRPDWDAFPLVARLHLSLDWVQGRQLPPVFLGFGRQSRLESLHRSQILKTGQICKLENVSPDLPGRVNRRRIFRALRFFRDLRTRGLVRLDVGMDDL